MTKKRGRPWGRAHQRRRDEEDQRPRDEEDCAEDKRARGSSRRRRRTEDPPVFDDGPPGVAPGPPDLPVPSRGVRRRHGRGSELGRPSPEHVPSSRSAGRPRPSRADEHLATFDDRNANPLPRRDPDQRGGRRGFGRRGQRGQGGQGDDRRRRKSRSQEVIDVPRDADVSDDNIPVLEESKGLWGKRRRQRKEEEEEEEARRQEDNSVHDEDFDEDEVGFDPPMAEEEDAEADHYDDQILDDDAHPAQAGTNKNMRVVRNRPTPMGDNDLTEVVYFVRLEMVPKEYNHETLVELHETIGLLDFQSSVVVDNPDDTPATHTMMLRYGSQSSAETAVAQLHGQSVANGAGEVWELTGKFTKKEVSNPMLSVYISDLPTDFTDRMLAEMHKDCGLGPEAAPLTIKRLTMQDPLSETSCCIARYKTSAAADSAINALHGLPVTTVSGQHKTLGARRAKPAKWMDGFGGAGAYTSGAYSPEGGPGAYGGGADYGAGKGGGKGQKGKDQALECGVTLFGKVKSWNMDRSFGILRAENGGPDVFVHRKALCDGSFLEPGTDVTFEVEFDAAKGYRATMCHGATGPDPRQPASAVPPGVFPGAAPPHGPPNTVPPPDLGNPQCTPPDPQVVPPELQNMSPELKGFCNFWGLDHSCAAHLASFDEQMQTQILTEFNPSFTDGRVNINTKVRHFVKCLQQRLDSGIPEGSPIPGVVKEWNEASQFGLVAYEDGKENAPQILVQRSALTDGSHLIVGANVVFEAEWDATRGMHTASTCSGAEGEVPEPLVLGDDLAAFNTQFDFSRPTLVHLQELNSDVLARVIADFPATVANTDKANTNYNTVVRAFTVAMKAKARIHVPVGVMLNGKCHQWIDAKGYGFVVADDGGGKIFVHCSHIVDGDVLEQGAPVRFEVQWEPMRRRYTATKCEGGVSRAPIMSSDLEAFKRMWDVDQDTINYLGSFQEEVQAHVIKEFDPHITENEISADPDRKRMHARLRNFAKSVRDNLGKVSAQPEGPLEVSQQLSYFGKLWDLDEETVEWIARLPADVQTAVTEEFMGTFTDETLIAGADAEGPLPPREEVFVSGVPSTLFDSSLPDKMQHGVVEQLFSQFGQVLACRVLTTRRDARNAIVRMSSVNQAKMAVEDLHRRVPHGFPAQISVRFMIDKKEKTDTDELKVGVWLTGKLSAFYADRGFGFIQPDGGGPDVFCFGSAKGAASKPLERGANVTFEADWNEERKQYFTTKVAVVGSVTPGEEGSIRPSRTVRAFARHVHLRLKPSTVGVLGPLKMPSELHFTFKRPASTAPPPHRNPALPAPGGGLALWQTPAAKAVATAAIAKLFEKANGGRGLAFTPPSAGVVQPAPVAPHVAVSSFQQGFPGLEPSLSAPVGITEEALAAGEPGFDGLSDLDRVFADDGSS